MKRKVLYSTLASLGVLTGCSVSTQDMGSLSGVSSRISEQRIQRLLSQTQSTQDYKTAHYALLTDRLRDYIPSKEGKISASLLSDPLSPLSTHLTVQDVWPARKFGEQLEMCVEMPGQGRQRMFFSNRDFEDSKLFASTMINFLRQVENPETPHYTHLKNKDMFGEYSFFTITPRGIGSPNIAFSSLEYYGWGGGVPTERSNRHVTIQYNENPGASQSGVSFSETIQRGLRFATGAVATETLNLLDLVSRKVLNRTRNPVVSTAVLAPLGMQDSATALWHQFASVQVGQPEKIIIYLDYIDENNSPSPRLVIATGPKESGASFFEHNQLPDYTLILNDKQHTERIEWPFLGELEETRDNLRPKRSP